MRAYAFAAVLGVFLAAPAWAANPGAIADNAATGTTGAATDTTTDKATDSHLAAAMDLLDANGSVDNLSAMLDAVAPLQALAIKRQVPDLSAEQIASLQAALKAELMARIGELKLILAKAYVAHFSEDELHTLAAFYRTDTGKKYVGIVPTMMKEVTPAEAAWVMSVALDVARKSQNGHEAGDHT